MGSSSKKLKTLDTVLKGLMGRYKERVPDVKLILNAMAEEGVIENEKEIENDHIAFRTMGVPQLGVKSFEKIFLHYGYEKRDHYFFEGKKLDAWWYSPLRETDPRIFVSELRVGDLSKESQNIIRSYTDEVVQDPVDDLDLDNGLEVDAFLHKPLWRTPALADYKTLLQESEYAAWVIYNRYYLNHFTISVHNLPEGYNTVAGFNEFLESNGVKLNTSGGKIKISPDGGLIQSATIAEMIEARSQTARNSRFLAPMWNLQSEKFCQNSRICPKIRSPACTEEMVFEASNADKIFESTYTTQTSK